MFRDARKRATQKKTKVIIPYIGSHISLKPVFFFSCFLFLLFFLCAATKNMLWLIALLFNVWMELNKAWSRTNKMILHTLSLMTLICWFFGYSYTKHWTKQKKQLKTNSWVTGFEGDRFVFWGGVGVAGTKTKNAKTWKTQNTRTKKQCLWRKSWAQTFLRTLCVFFFCFPFVISFLAVLVPIKASGAKNQKKQGKPKTHQKKKLQKKQCLKQSAWPRHSWESFLLF